MWKKHQKCRKIDKNNHYLGVILAYFKKKEYLCTLIFRVYASAYVHVHE